MPDTPLNPDALDSLIEQVQEAIDHVHLDPREFFDLSDVLYHLKAVAQPELQATSKPKQNLEFVNILEILVAHRTLASSPADKVCACDRTWRPDTEYRAHLAEVLDKHMQEREAEAWDEGADAEFGRSVLCLSGQANPYKETE